MKKNLTNNFWMKIISLCLAIVLWLFVVRLADPEISSKISDVKVTIENESVITDKDKTYEVTGGATVSLMIQGPTSIVNQMSAEDFTAVADLSKLSLTNSVPVEIKAKRYAGQVTIENAYSNVLTVSIEDISKINPVVKAVGKGTVSPGRYLGDVNAEPNMVEIEGPQSKISRIKEVTAEINVNGAVEDRTEKVNLVLRDEKGEIIDHDNLTFSSDQVDVTASLLWTKVLPVTVYTEGDVASGYVISTMDYSPKQVEVAGSKDDLAQINSLELGVDVSGMSSNVTSTINNIEDQIPEELQLTSSDNKVVAAVSIEKTETKTMTTAFSGVTMQGSDKSYSYTIVGDSSIEYSVTGGSSALEKITSDKVKLFVDVSDLIEGTYTLPLEADLEDGMTLSTTYVKIKITPNTTVSSTTSASSSS